MKKNIIGFLALLSIMGSPHIGAVESKEEKKHLIPLENLDSYEKDFFTKMSEKMKQFEQVTSDYLDKTKEEMDRLLEELERTSNSKRPLSRVPDIAYSTIRDLLALKDLKEKELWNFNIISPAGLAPYVPFLNIGEVQNALKQTNRVLNTLIERNTIGEDTYIEPSTLKSLKEKTTKILEEYNTLVSLYEKMEKQMNDSSAKEIQSLFEIQPKLTDTDQRVKDFWLKIEQCDLDKLVDDGLEFFKNFEEHFKKLQKLVRQTGNIMDSIVELSK